MKPSKQDVTFSGCKSALPPAFLITLLFCLLFSNLCAAQQPVPPAPSPPESAAQPPASPSAKQSESKSQRKIPPFLILGTVFNEHDFAFPDVQVRVRRKGEKKFRYEMYTNSRGEFAVRVPDGIHYEVVVSQKKYKEQTQEVAANMQDVQKRLTFKLEPNTPTKAGESK